MIFGEWLRAIPNKGSYLHTLDVQHIVGPPGDGLHYWRISYADDTNTIQREIFTDIAELSFFLERLMRQYEKYKDDGVRRRRAAEGAAASLHHVREGDDS